MNTAKFSTRNINSIHNLLIDPSKRKSFVINESSVTTEVGA